MKLRPLLDKVVLKKVEALETTKAGILLPSNADLMTTELIRQRFLNEKVKFLEHYIIAGDAWSTLLDHRTGKKYITLKDLLT